MPLFLFALRDRAFNILAKREFKKMEGAFMKPKLLQGCKYISIGTGTVIADGAIITAIDKYKGKTFMPSITIGDGCVLGESIHITACGNIAIGNRVLTGRYVFISDNSHGDTTMKDLSIPPTLRPLRIKGDVCIGDDVWLGERTTILSGVNIGKNVIIAANSVVTHDIPPFCVAAGVPAKVIKQMKN